MRFIYTKAFAVFFGTLVLAALLIFFHYKGWFGGFQRAVLQLPRPINYAVRRAAEPVRSFFAGVYRLREIAKENAKLETRVFELQNRQALFDQYRLENEQLKKELQFVKVSKLSLQPCAVIGRSPAGLTDSVALNCGLEVGAQAGRALVSRGFLVGKITYAAQGFSTAQLITSANFFVDARISQSGRLAIVRGSFNSGLVLEQAAQDEPLEPGTLVVTAGVSEKVPKNLLIGEVGEILSQKNELFKKASLVSPIDFTALEFVLLVK